MANLLSTWISGSLNSTGRITTTYNADRYQFNFNRASASNWWVTNDSDKLGLHIDSVGDRFYFGTGGDFWSSANGWLSTALAAKQNASTAITTSNIGSQSVSYATSAGNADTVDGLHASAFAPRAYVTDSYVEFTIEGDANTYYPVTIHNWNGTYSWQRYSIHRSYSDPAPWDPIGTGVHRGGLTFAFEWAGDIAWGGNDKSIRVIEFYETYTTMVTGLQLAHCEGVVVWLRGGGAYYRLHGPGGRSQSYSINMSTWTSCAGVQYSPMSYDSGRVNSQINNRYPIRNNGEIIYAESFVDINDANYNVNPNGTSNFLTANILNTYVGNAIYFGGGNNYLNWTNSRINSNVGIQSTSDMRAPIFYDSQDTGFYVDPNSNSRLSQVYVDNVYNYGWFRNYGNQGIYNQDYGNHWYATSNATWNAAGNNGGYVEIAMRTGGHQGPIRGYFYADNSDNIGIVNSGGSWSLRMSSTRNAEIFGSDLTIGVGGANATNIIMGDNDEGGRVIHCNSNRIGFLTQAGAWGAWLYDSADWEAASSVRAPIFYDSNDTTYYLDPNNTLKSLNIAGNIDLIARSASWAEGIRVRVPSTSTWGGIRFTRDRGNDDGNWAIGYTGIDSTDDLTFWGNSGGNGAMRMRIDQGANLSVYGSVYSPIYYDINNAGYYGDFASTSVMNAIRLGTSTNSGTISGGGDWGIRFANDNGWIQFGPANNSWTHIYTDKNFYFNQNLYVNGALVALNGSSPTFQEVYANGWFRTTGNQGLYNPTNGAHFYANNGTFGPWRIDGSRNGYNGLEFGLNNGNVSLMAHVDSNTTGFHNNSYGWQFYWENGRLFCSKNSYGGGTMAVVLDTSNVGEFAIALSGNQTASGEKKFQTNAGGYSGSLSSPSLQAFATGANSAFMSFHRSGSYAVNMGLDADNVLRVGGWSAGSNRMQLDMSGNVTFAGDVTAYSDARVKTNVSTIENALDKTLKLRGVSYNRIDSDDKSTKIGVIAQEILEVVPEVVNQDNDGMYNVSYGNITALLIEAIKEQQKQIDELKAKLDGLTK